MRGRGLRLLALAAGLATVGLTGHAMGAPPTRLIKIGALTESWGPTPGIVGLREGLLELG
jgi:hypothetical protein